MTKIISLNENYSTTRCLIKVKPNHSTFHLNRSNIIKNKTQKGGLRTGGYSKRSFDNKPLISVVTVVYNSEKYLKKTIESVLSQNYDNIEYLIIDGGSTDSTIDIIKKYEDKLDYWISEPDNGVYDAMNKAIDTLTGKWVNFINSSDILNDNAYTKIIDFLVKNLNKCDVVAFGYSIVNIRDSRLTTDFQPNLNKDWKMPSCHNSMIYKSNVIKDYKFDLRFKYASDFEQINKIKKNKIIYKNNFILLTGRDDGFVAKNKLDMFYEYFQICWKYVNKFYALYWLTIFIVEYIFSSILKKRKLKF